MNDIPLNEIVALAIAVLLALALLSFLAYARMAQAGLPEARRRGVLVSVWLLVGGLIALLLALRALSGGPVIQGSPSAGGLWLGLQPRQVAALLIAAALLILGTVRIRAVLLPMESGPVPVPPAPAEDTEPDADS